MRRENLIVFTVLLIATAFSCPENCQTCGADVTKCEVCSAGYQLAESTGNCDVGYNLQSEWSGVCNTGKKQSPINIETSGNKVCPAGADFYQSTNIV